MPLSFSKIWYVTVKIGFWVLDVKSTRSRCEWYKAPRLPCFPSGFTLPFTPAPSTHPCCTAPAVLPPCCHLLVPFPAVMQVGWDIEVQIQTLKCLKHVRSWVLSGICVVLTSVYGKKWLSSMTGLGGSQLCGKLCMCCGVLIFYIFESRFENWDLLFFLAGKM